MEKSAVILKEGREKPIFFHHPWIFSGAIKSLPEPFVNGEIYPVYSAKKEKIGFGYFNCNTSLSGRMIFFGDGDPFEAMHQHLKEAIHLRQSLFDEKTTTACRLVNAEGDFLPGLIVDRYGDYLVVQIGTLGMERLKEKIIGWLKELLPVKGIYEKSQSGSRYEEGLGEKKGPLFGDIPDEIAILEEGKKFLVHIARGQKSGFFLDQREMRKEVGRLAKNRRVLNGFSYSGGFSIWALANSATSVDTVDSSEDAIALARRNCELNGFGSSNSHFYCEDLFAFLEKSQKEWDLVILDPPAFAKRKEDIPHALKGYMEINRLGMLHLAKGGILFTASCSYHIDEITFQRAILKAAIRANREVKIIGHHRLAFDHPISLAHPEGSYLKSLILQVI